MTEKELKTGLDGNSSKTQRERMSDCILIISIFCRFLSWGTMVQTQQLDLT